MELSLIQLAQEAIAMRKRLLERLKEQGWSDHERHELERVCEHIARRWGEEDYLAARPTNGDS